MTNEHVKRFLTPVAKKCKLNYIDFFIIVLTQSLSYVWLFATSQTAVHQASLSFTISQNLLKLKSIELVMPSNHLTLFSFCLQSFPASGSFPRAAKNNLFLDF